MQHFIGFDMLCFYFNLRYFFISRLILSLAFWLFSSVLFNFYISVYFTAFHLLLISSLIPLWLENIFGVISIFLNLLSLVYDFSLISLLENVPWALKRMCILLLLNTMFFIYLFHLVLSMVHIQCFFVDFLSGGSIHC